uniref:SOUL heme-binding protein n=1 Tax=Crocus sativus TaxID=82528 RepID=A0A1S5T4X3_CROSA|nr:SOUL heme-binding protein [Crocus sativus]
MGMVLGKIGVETPKYSLVRTTGEYEIRKYPPSVTAQVTYDPSESGDRGVFTILANYIGAFGDPHNSIPEKKIAMTAPVITSKPEKISMTAPVITTAAGGVKESSSAMTMQFVLPAKYAKAEDAPKPTDERVAIREEGERAYGVVRFSGVAHDKAVEERLERLRGSLERDGYKVVGEFLLARYNPPWITLPPFRTNEVMLPVEQSAA